MPAYSDWTEEETTTLLEAIMKVGEEWDVVAHFVKTKTMEQCVLHFARMPIADRYLIDMNPTIHDGAHVDKLLTQYSSATSALALASEAFPHEWSPEWTQWLQGLVSLNAVDAAALGPALGAAMAVIDGTLDETEPSANLNCHAHECATGGGERRVDGDEEGSESARAEEDWDEWEVEIARPSPDHPWMSVLKWPAPGGLPRLKKLKKDDSVLLLSEEAGRYRRGRVQQVHSAKAGIVSVDFCAGEGVKVLQLYCTHYRVLTLEEVATIERAIGCRFMELSPAELQQQLSRKEHASETVEAVQVSKIRKITTSEPDAPAARRPDTAINGKSPEVPSKLRCDDCPNGVGVIVVGGGGGRDFIERGGREDDMHMHRKTLWDEVGGCLCV